MSNYRYPIIACVFILFVAALAFYGPIPQDVTYHNYADQRTLFGIPNFWDVVSNIPFLFIGIWGLRESLKNWSKRPGTVAKLIPVILSCAIFTACFGSAQYHLAPDNLSLAWDRLPMTLMFMPIFSLLIYDFIGRKQGEYAFYTLLPLGIFSVFYWRYTESIGAGDLRLYAFVQFFPMLIAPFILWLFPKKKTYVKYILYILFWYCMAKICEHFDHEVYALTAEIWSGHTIKHLLSAISLVYVVKLFKGWESESLSIDA